MTSSNSGSASTAAATASVQAALAAALQAGQISLNQLMNLNAQGKYLIKLISVFLIEK